MRSSYSKHYRPILTALVETLTFRSNNELHQPLIFALNLIKKYIDSARGRLAARAIARAMR